MAAVRFLILSLFFLLVLGGPLQAGKNVLLIAGKHSHGEGEHEFPEGCALLARALNESGLDIRAEVSLGWPTDEAKITGADSIVLYSDGLENHVAKGHVSQLRQHMSRGKGLAVIHFALEPSDPEMREFLNEAIGGSFEVNWSVNPVWTLRSPLLGRHAVSAGVEMEPIKDEWYYHLRFRENVIPILKALPPEDSLGSSDGPRSGNVAVRKDLAGGIPQTLAWVVENKNGSRGFGLTGGHFHSNWEKESFRKLVLNAIVWTAGIEPPNQGVVSQVAPILRYPSIDKAIALGEPEDVRRFLNANPGSLNQGERAGTPPLHQAILRNRTEIALLLIEAGADVNLLDSGKRSPLHVAVERNNPVVVRKLMEKKAMPDLKDKDGWTPLHHAAAKNLYDIAVILLDGGANGMALSERGGTALHEAAASADARFVELLLQRGVDPAVVSLNGDTALSIARQFHNEAALKILTQNLPNPFSYSKLLISTGVVLLLAVGFLFLLRLRP